MIGKIIDKYEVTGELGRGGMGVVYRAVDTMLHREVALKLMIALGAHNDTLMKRFQSEAQALARLDHPNIVRIMDFRKTDQGWALVMEFVDGVTLTDAVTQKGAMGWREAVTLNKQLLEALKYAHDNKVIHRDIKPSNILIRNDGRVKVTDFGLAKITDPDANSIGRGLTQTGMVAGTLYYMSPEQVKGLDKVDERCDLYAAGITLYESLTGRIPFDKTSSNYEVQKLIVEGSLPSPKTYVSDIPTELAKIVMTSIEKKPERRYQSAGDMIAALTAFEKKYVASADQSEAPESTLMGALAGLFRGRSRSSSSSGTRTEFAPTPGQVTEVPTSVPTTVAPQVVAKDKTASDAPAAIPPTVRTDSASTPDRTTVQKTLTPPPATDADLWFSPEKKKAPPAKPAVVTPPASPPAARRVDPPKPEPPKKAPPKAEQPVPKAAVPTPVQPVAPVPQPRPEPVVAPAPVVQARQEPARVEPVQVHKTEKKSNGALFGIIGAVLVVAVLAMIFVLQPQWLGMSAEEVNPATAQPGTLVDGAAGVVAFQVSPSDAELVVDGIQVPAAQFSGYTLAPGNHQIELFKDGYAFLDTMITVTAGASSDLALSLQKMAEPDPSQPQVLGSLSVASQPVGADVLVDGRRVGRTPFSGSNIPVGSRRISVRLNGYDAFSQRVTVSEQGTSQVTANLVKAAERPAEPPAVIPDRPVTDTPVTPDAPPRGGTATLVLRADGRGVTATVNGRAQSLGSAAVISPGNTSIVFSNGQASVSHSVNLSRGASEEVKVFFRGFLNIQVQDGDGASLSAAISVDGASLGEKSRVNRHRLDAGTYRVVVSKPGYSTFEQSVNINPTIGSAPSQTVRAVLRAN